MRPTNDATSSSKPDAWMPGLEKLVKAQAGKLDRYEQIGANTDANSPKGRAALANLPAGVREFFNKQLGAIADNDGSAAAYKFPLSDLSPNLKGAAFAVRWTSEDGSLDRLWVFDSSGKGIAKGTTDSAGDLSWTLTSGPFQIDDTPHSS
jgi:hypothetical protein